MNTTFLKSLLLYPALPHLEDIDRMTEEEYEAFKEECDRRELEKEW